MIEAKAKDGHLYVEMTGALSTIIAEMTHLLVSVCRNIGKNFPHGTAEEKEAVSGIVLEGIIADAREALDRKPDSEIVVVNPVKLDGQA